MITADQILPSIYHLQRLGVVGKIAVCARRSLTLETLASNPELSAAFPGAAFDAAPGRFQDAIAAMSVRQVVIVAVPDAQHHEVVMESLRRGHHVICVKPLAQRHRHGEEIAALAYDAGLFVGVEYHKRFDRRALVARGLYREGRLGAFVMGEARLHEPYAYRHSNFQNWFTCDQADPFTYIGCHYVDLVHFITGLNPTAVSVDAVKGAFPNGNEGYLWSSARVRFENDALLTVTNGLGYPDDAAGSNDQGLVMYCEGPGRTGMINHDDHERGVRYAFVETGGHPRYRYVSPDYFRLVPWEGEGSRPVGYGYDSIEALIVAVRRVDAAPGLADRRVAIKNIDAAGLLATPANSAFNEQLVEAARVSIARGGENVRLDG